ncbi:RNA polymerase subunit sigma [Nocardiopsis sp. TSRI0078]|uniref:sigma-70 family RNA polymerase sigma factor n=1 Tax=unclassified Nocardiopsis TaxID=2649073 RepID=UPI00093BF011|nr:sigma-70 family RNA polymerase sigma factor [Nocardiopsis sp. TSRI0078]OKI15253.1 RNA polymerase subunit sigma [Nocardiopsis sp. TSRI0078]
MPTDTMSQEQRPLRARHPSPRPTRRPRTDRPAGGPPNTAPAQEEESPSPEEHGREHDRELDRLALAARRGSDTALEAFVRRTRPGVTRYIARRVHSDRVEELTQETYLRALHGLPRFAGRAPARAWLLAIARNTVVDRYRGDAARPDCVRPTDWDLLPERSARFDEYVVLRALLEGLPAERRQAFVLTQVEGLTYAEAARSAGVPVGTIRSRVARARGELLRGFTA